MQTEVFCAEIQELHRILQWLKVHLEKKRVASRDVHCLELALEEAVVNVINHSYRGRKGKVEIGLKWTKERLEVVVRDWGPPFDPIANAPKVNPEAPLEERKLGGLGIFLMKQLLDEIIYQRVCDANVLTLVKHFSRTT